MNKQKQRAMNSGGVSSFFLLKYTWSLSIFQSGITHFTNFKESGSISLVYTLAMRDNSLILPSASTSRETVRLHL